MKQVNYHITSFSPQREVFIEKCYTVNATTHFRVRISHNQTNLKESQPCFQVSLHMWKKCVKSDECVMLESASVGAEDSLKMKEIRRCGVRKKQFLPDLCSCLSKHAAGYKLQATLSTTTLQWAVGGQVALWEMWRFWEGRHKWGITISLNPFESRKAKKELK